MIQKLDHQLNWIINNEASYSKEEVKAAHEELKRRANGPSEMHKLKDGFEKHWKRFKAFWD